MKLRSKTLTLSLFAAVFLGRSFAARDNSQFIDNTFWQDNPTDEEVVDAIFGNSEEPELTAYTKHREDNSCIGENMIVEYIAEDQLPENLIANTIYVLEGNQILNTTTTTTGNECTAIIGKGNIEINYDGIGTSPLISIYEQEGIVIDNITGNGAGVTSNFLQLAGGKNITLHNISAKSFLQQGIVIGNSEYISMNKISTQQGENYGLYFQNVKNVYGNEITTSNNNRGFRISSGENVYMNNIISTNNTSFGGIINQNSTGVIINNGYFFNNENTGLSIEAGTNIIIQNSIFYHQTTMGLQILNSENTVLHNIDMSHNGYNMNIINSNNTTLHNIKNNYRQNEGIRLFESNNTVGYGNIENTHMFESLNVNENPLDNAITEIGEGTTFTLGSENTIGRAEGVVTNTLADRRCDMMTFGLNFTTFPYCDEGYGQQSWTVSLENFTFGENISFQSPTVIYSGDEIVLDTEQVYTSYDSNKYIADLSFGGYITTPDTNNEYYLEGQILTNSNTIQLVPGINDDVLYHLSGDIDQTYTGVINGPTAIDIERSTGNDIKIVTSKFTALEGPYSGQTSNTYLLLRFLDTTGPSAPTIISPQSGDSYEGYTLNLNWNIDLINAVILGISGYNYEISTSDEFDSILHSGSTQDTSVTVTDITPNNYYRRVKGVDNLGNTGERASTGPVLYGFSGFDIALENTSFPTNEGQTISITAYDTDNNVITGYQGTVTVSIAGVDTVPNPDYNEFTLPQDYTFTTNNEGEHTFQEDIIITNPGVYEITIQDTEHNNRTTSTTVTAMGAYPDGISGTLDITPAYTNGPIIIEFTASEPSNFILEGPIQTYSGTTNGEEEHTTQITADTQDGEQDIQLTLYTGYYQHIIDGSVILDTTAPTVTLISPSNETITTNSQVGLSRSNNEGGSSFSGYIIHIEGIDNDYDTTTSTNSNSMNTSLDDGTYQRTVYAHDKAGNIGQKTRTFTIDTTAPEIESASPSDEIVAVPFTFNRNLTDEDDVEQATIVVYDNNNNIVAGPAQTTQTSITTSALGINGLPSGVYTRSLTVTDGVGNEQTENYAFGVENGIAGQIDGSVNISSLFGTVNLYDNTYYTNTTQLQAHIFANQNVTADINGDINPSQLGLNILMPFPYITQAITLTNTNGNKNINTTLSAPGLADKTILTNIVLDTQNPSTVTLLHPTNGDFINNETLFDRSDATDQISDIGVYKRNIATNQNFTNIIASGETMQSEVIIDTDTLAATGLFYRQVVTYDQAGNMSTSNYSTFQYNGTTTDTDTTPNNFTFDEITNATPGQTYTSQTITISGLGANIQTTIEINTGTLYIDNIFSGLTGTVSNGSQVKIELQASSNYAESVTSTVSVGSINTPFTLTTKQEPISASGLNTLQITTDPSNPEEDERIDIRIRARNNNGNILTNYQGTIEFSIEYLDGRVRRTANNNDYTLEENEYTFTSDDDGDTTIENLLRLENDQKNYRIVAEDTQADIEGFKYFCLRNDNCHEEGATTLSRSQRLQIGIIFNSLVNAYEQNPDIAILFFAALEDAVTNLINSANITSLEDEALRYFRDLTRSFLESLGGVENTGSYDGSIYVAPNGKQYRVSFNIQRQAYTSPDFSSPKYYISLEAFQAHINANNAGPQPGQFINGNNQTNTQNPNSGLLDDLFGGNSDLNTPTGDVIIAPNGKVYRVTINNGQYTSPDFIYPRQFPSYNALRNHIYTHNQ